MTAAREPRAPEPIPILLAEDDPGMRSLLSEILRSAGYEVDVAEDGQEALERLRLTAPRLLITDMKMPRMDGVALLRKARAERPGLPVIVLTAFGTVSGAVEAMRLGAFDYLSKPLPDPERLRQGVARALAEGQSGASSTGRAPVHADPAFAQVLELVSAVAPRDTTVLLTGESGVGKEVIAQAVHEGSPRRDGPFVAINCAALPESLLESELFGHERGAFTGAVSAHPGLFEQASGGTLLLDEVGEMQAALQAKLLRVLESHRVTRLGSTKDRSVDVRVIAATNRDLDAAVSEGLFRQDLLFRLKVFPIHIPPLRERPMDILPLARHFLELLGSSPGRTLPRLGPEAQEALLAHSWPGNVRELMNAVERASILAGGGDILPEHLGISSAPRGAVSPDPGSEAAPGPEAPSRGVLTLREMERLAVMEALEAVGGNRKAAARRLGIALRTLQYKLKEYGIT
ncbi:MAG: sigma-54 dependent transcriptional regulator [Polyangia bacterium]|jgi:two-component system response regulator FlrC|nr:sigma-54 dependent transcriptional regulator [Polyangia bacterium]